MTEHRTNTLITSKAEKEGLTISFVISFLFGKKEEKKDESFSI